MKPIRHEIIPPEERFLHSPEDCATLKKGCQFIREIGSKIGFPNRTVLTAQWYFRKFYQTRALSTAPSLDIALTTVILASKVEESFERIRSVLVTAFLILNGNSFQGRLEDIKITDEHKNRVIQYERDVLIAIGFHFNLTHPHNLLIKLANTLKISKESSQKSWNLLDKWYAEEDFVIWEAPHTLALSALNFNVKQDEKGRLLDFVKENSFRLLEFSVYNVK